MGCCATTRLSMGVFMSYPEGEGVRRAMAEV